MIPFYLQNMDGFTLNLDWKMNIQDVSRANISQIYLNFEFNIILVFSFHLEVKHTPYRFKEIISGQIIL